MKRLVLMSIIMFVLSLSFAIGCGDAKKDMKEEAPAEKMEEPTEMKADTAMSEEGDEEMMDESETE